MATEQVITEARARIIWGDSAASIRDYLVSSGFSISDAAVMVAEFNLERNRELRRIARRDLLVGCLVITAAGIALGLLFSAGWSGGWVGSGAIKADAFVLLAAAYGLWKIGRGVLYLVSPSSGRKSIPDIVESDILE